MTIETLDTYAGIISNLKAVRKEKESLKEFEQIQTETAVSELIHILDGEERRLEVSLSEIEAWVTTLDSPEIQSIIRWRYVLGYSWRDTNRMIYGDPDPHRARKKLFRFFGRE